MIYYPVNLKIKDKSCLVVGGGRVGTRKVKGLMQCEARVVVVSPMASIAIEKLAEKGRIVWKKKDYEASDLEGFFLVIGATSDQEVNWQISRDADEREMICNIADVPDACNFILPSVIRRGPLTITVSTSGQSPAFAKSLRRELESMFGPEYELFLSIMGGIRKKLLSEDHDHEAHKPLFEAIIKGGLLDMCRSKDIKAMDNLLFSVLGEGYSCSEYIGIGQGQESGDCDS